MEYHKVNNTIFQGPQYSEEDLVVGERYPHSNRGII